jgi:hypothetical protein
MDYEKIKNIVEEVTRKYYYDYTYTIKQNYVDRKTDISDIINCIIINFIETKYSHIRPDQYFEMTEEIIYNRYIINYKTELLRNKIIIFNKDNFLDL